MNIINNIVAINEVSFAELLDCILFVAINKMIMTLKWKLHSQRQPMNADN